MKKLALTIGIVLTMGLCASAQSLLQREDNDGGGFRDDPGLTIPTIPNYGQTGDQDGETPLGSGILLLAGMGAAYLLKNKKND